MYQNFKIFLKFFLIQFCSYTLLVWNYRVVAKGWLGQSVVSDGLISLYNFIVFKKIVEEKSRWAQWGYVAGGMIGSAAGIQMTKYFLGV